MKYILMMHAPRNAYEGFGAWSKQAIEAHIGFMLSLNKSLQESGELVDAQGLGNPMEAKQVRAGDDGEPVTDGVFPEAKEFLAGYWIIDVKTADEAYRIAARASAAPGPNGAPLKMPIEVREIPSGPPPA